MRAPALIGIVASLHIVGLGALVLIQGCGTTRPMPETSRGEPPPPPVMPPRVVPTAPTVATPGPAAGSAAAPAAVGATHALRKGETLSHLAKRYGVSIGDLTEFNQITNADRVHEGQKIKIPGYARKLGGAGAPAPVPDTGTTVPAAAPGAGYVVQSGDTLSKIASLYGTTVSDLREANGLATDRILIGQKLTIPGDAGSSAPAALAGVSLPPAAASAPAVDDLNMDVDVLDLDATALDTTDVRIEEIRVPPAVGTPSVSSPGGSTDVSAGVTSLQDKPIIYTVVEGDTIDEIAKLFIVSKGEILELNRLGPGAELSPGQQIKIPPSAL